MGQVMYFSAMCKLKDMRLRLRLRMRMPAAG